MDYLLSQIGLYLGLVALIAGLAGWFLRGGSKNKINAAKTEWQSKLARAQNERDYYAGEVKSLTAMAEDREDVERNYQNEKQALSVQLDDMRVDSEMTSEAFKDQEHLLKQQAIELDASNRALLAKNDEGQQFEQASLQLRGAEETISDLQTELDSTKIQLLDTTDKLSITEARLAESQRLLTEEKQSIPTSIHSSPAPAPIEKTASKVKVQARNIPGSGSLLATPTSSVEIVDAHDKTRIQESIAEKSNEENNTSDAIVNTANTQVKIAEQALDDEFAHENEKVVARKKNDADYKSETLASAAAAALGMAEKMKDKLNQEQDENFDKVELASDDYSIEDMHIINSEEAKYLKQMNIMSTEDMLEKCSSKEGVELIAKSMGRENWVIRSWVSVADLMRVEGVDDVNAELLELAGISSVQALTSAKVSKLAESIKVIHKHVGKTHYVPEHDEIETWIKRAKDLPVRLDDHLDKL